MIGFDDLELAELLRPPLSVISRPAVEQGVLAMRLLRNRIEDKGPRLAQKIVLDTQLLDAARALLRRTRTNPPLIAVPLPRQTPKERIRANERHHRRAASVHLDRQPLAGYNENYAIAQMGGYAGRVEKCTAMLSAARSAGIPVIFLQERHSRTLVDFGRELDGQEEVHCVEDDADTEPVPALSPLPDEYHVIKRRYSAFFGTDLEILLKGLNATTLILCGALTDVCVHYTFVDAHQNDYRVRIAADAVGGSSQAAPRCLAQRDGVLADRSVAINRGDRGRLQWL